MRRLAALAGLVLVVATAGAAPGATTGTIRGRVMNGTTGRPQSGVEVVLVAGGARSSERPVTTTTRADGRYAFPDLRTGDDRFYALDAHYAGGLFPGRAISLPADTSRPPVVESTLTVWETTTDPSVISLERDDLFVVLDRDGVGVIESVRVTNSSDRAYIGRARPGQTRNTARGSLGFALPRAAHPQSVAIVASDIDMPAIVPTDFGFATTTAIPPGTTSTTFSYGASGDAGSFDLSRPALYPTQELTVHAASPLEIRSNRLGPNGEVDLEGTRYRRWTAGEPLEAGDPLQVLAVAQAGGEAVRTAMLASVAVLAALGGGAFAVIRVRRRRQTPPPTGSQGREDIVVEIADLDLRHEQGTLSDTEWERRRAELKASLVRMGEGG